MRRTFHSQGFMTRLRAGLAPVLVLCALLLATGCVELTMPEASNAQLEQPVIQPTPELAAEAQAAYAARNMPLSELLYSRLLERADLSREERLAALEQLAKSAFASRHYYQARQALDKQANMDNSVLGTWPWHDLYIKTLGALDRPDLVETHQAWLAAHTELPYEVRSQAAIAFSEIYGRNGDFVRAVNVLARMHKQAPDKAAKAAMENVYTLRLREMPEAEVQALAKLVGRTGANAFPHALIQREAQRRGQPARHSTRQPSSQPAYADATGDTTGDATGGAVRPSLAPSQQLLAAQPALLTSLLAQSVRIRSDQPSDMLPANMLPNQKTGEVVRIALALPLSGRFAPTGWKVLRGAGAAQALLTAQGWKVELKAINTEAPDWRDQLAALPPDFRVVGGPLQVETFKALEAAGITGQRTVFAFVPDLGGSQEGVTAWRFFPSPQDQVRALLSLAVDKVGIRSVAVLAPRNRFGQRMAEIFQAEAKARGVRVAASATYPPDDHPRWKQSVAQLLKVPDSFRGNKSVPLPMPDFGAVFVPEDWAQAELLVSNFHFYEGDHLVFLGPELWSVALDNAKDVDDTYFQQAVCPGSWWPETAQAKALQAKLTEAQHAGGLQGEGPAAAQADFWAGLGHDFVQMAVRLNMPGDAPPELMNQRLSGMKGLPYSLAPITWDAQGRASEILHIFAPRKEGKILVDAEALRQAVEKSKDRRERRIKTSHNIRKAKESQ